MAAPIAEANMVTIKVLCDDISATVVAPPFILTNCDLNMRVEDLKLRIGAYLNGPVLAQRQRLIFRGKRFSDETTLRVALAPIDGTEFAVHLSIAPEPANGTPANEPPADTSSANASPNNEPPADQNRRRPELLRQYLRGTLQNQNHTTLTVEQLAPYDRDLSSFNAIRRHPEIGPPIPTEDTLRLVQRRLTVWDQHLRSERELNAAYLDWLHEYLSGIHDMDEDTAQRLSQQTWDIRHLISRIDHFSQSSATEIHNRLSEVDRPAWSRRFASTQGSSNAPFSASIRTSTGDAAHQASPTMWLARSPSGMTMILTERGVEPAPQPASGAASATPERRGEAPRQAPPQEANAAPNVAPPAAAPPAANGVIERAIGSAWLFVQLYAIIWMITPPDSWMRSLGVVFAAVAAWAQSSGFFLRVWRVVLDYFHHQVENLVARPDGAANPENIIWGWLLRVRRAVALLFASLIPGIGEQQVQAHNAAQALAERQRLAPEAAPEEQAAAEQGRE